jgi:hypothetical protein
MISKVLLVSAAVSGLLLAQPQTASAGTTVDVSIGSSPYYYPVQYDGGYPDYSSPGPSYHDDYGDENDEQITCSEGRRIVRHAGYRAVRTISCEGDIYRYRAVRGGYLWRISVESETGDIIRARRIRPISYTSY